MLVRLTNTCLLLLVYYAHFCICNFNQKEKKKKKKKKKKKRKKSIITFQLFLGLLCFEKIGLFSMLICHSIESCIMLNPFELCLYVYLHVFSF